MEEADGTPILSIELGMPAPPETTGMRPQAAPAAPAAAVHTMSASLGRALAAPAPADAPAPAYFNNQLYRDEISAIEQRRQKLPMVQVEEELVLPSYRAYTRARERESTFNASNWLPMAGEVEKGPQEMALCGLIRVPALHGNRDCVRCVFCEYGGIVNWKLADNPFLEHERLSPYCRWIRYQRIKNPEKFRKLSVIVTKEAFRPPRDNDESLL